MSNATSGESRHLAAGNVLRHVTGGGVVLRKRKDDESGWWLMGHGGLDDRALTSGDWFFVAESVADLVTRFERAVLSDIEARNPGIDLDEVQAHRDRTAVISGGSGADA